MLGASRFLPVWTSGARWVRRERIRDRYPAMISRLSGRALILICLCLAWSVAVQGLKYPPAEAAPAAAPASLVGCTESANPSSVQPHQECIAGSLWQTRQRITDTDCFKPGRATSKP